MTEQERADFEAQNLHGQCLVRLLEPWSSGYAISPTYRRKSMYHGIPRSLMPLVKDLWRKAQWCRVRMTLEGEGTFAIYRREVVLRPVLRRAE